MQHSESLAELAVALAKAQALIKQPGKVHSATIKSATANYGYKYADLPDVIEAYRKPFSDNGLSIVQSVSTAERGVSITTMLLHASGQWIKDMLYMPVVDNRPQAVGSAITYGRRYAVAAMVGVAPDEDDDGHAAQGTSAKPPEDGSGDDFYDPTIYRHKKKLMDKLKGTSVSKELWGSVSEVMKGKTSDYFNKAVESVLFNVVETDEHS